MMNLTAILPARENSNGKLVNKDTLPFADTNLLIHKINQLKKIEGLDIVISTESSHIADMVDGMGVRVLLRPMEFACPNAKFGEFVSYVCNQVDSENILWTCVTSPLVTSKIYSEAIEKYYQAIKDGFDSLITVQRLQRYLMDQNGALNFKPGSRLKNENELPELYIFTNGISIAPREKMLKWKYTSGDLPYMFELDKVASIDICDDYDYACAKFFYGRAEDK